MTNKEAIEMIKDHQCVHMQACDECMEEECEYWLAMKALARPTGKWIEMVDADPMTGEPYPCGAYCDQCGETTGVESNYCPNCGCPMEKGTGDGTIL